MKRLQSHVEEHWEFMAPVRMEGIIRRPPTPRKFILLLHGLNERGRRIFRKLLAYLPEDAVILAPNGPYPVPKSEERQLSLGYAWYYYDRQEQQYLVPQDQSRAWLKKLLELHNTEGLPVTIIGFSQGGYLAPLVGQDNPLVEMVISIGCEMRAHFFPGPIHYRLETIHGEKDDVILTAESKKYWEELLARGYECGWHLIPDTGHEITPQVGMKVKELLQDGKRSL